jgi:hypothetical protein
MCLGITAAHANRERKQAEGSGEFHPDGREEPDAAWIGHP